MRTASNLLALAFAVLFWTTSAPSRAQEAVSEPVLKAAFIYNFAKFVEWPADAYRGSGDRFQICLYGIDSVSEALNSIAGQMVGPRKIEIQTLAPGDNPVDCQVAYIGQSERPKLRQALNKMADLTVLTIGDMPSFAEQGGMINLRKVGGKIRFQINLAAARRSGLRISSRLLRLAQIVASEGGTP